MKWLCAWMLLCYSAAFGQGLTGEYYSGSDFNERKFVRVDQNIDFNWDLASPVPGVVSEDFSAVWSGTIKPPSTGTYQFVTNSDDGVRLFVDGKKIIDDWNYHGPTYNYGRIRLSRGKQYKIELRYFDGAVWASLRLGWSGPGIRGTKSAAPYCTPATVPPVDPPDDPDPPTPTGNQLVLAHYMPWHRAKGTPPNAGQWGWHWTMNKYNPDAGQIASHFYPVIGPYDNTDPALIEYHVLLMKLAGINGVIADWYGPDELNDYGFINRATLATFAELKRRGMQFAINYDENVVGKKGPPYYDPSQKFVNGWRHLQYAQDTWMRDPNHAKIDGRPVLLSFGSETFSPADWNQLLPKFSVNPALFLLHRLKPPAAGSFGWSPMWMNSGGELSPDMLHEYLGRLYREKGYVMGVIVPGFKDIYAQAGVHASYGYLDARDGATFRETLQLAVESKCPLIQIQTWNDFGEGTNIEPTREYGTYYLAQLQKTFAPQFTPADLELPLAVFQLRKAEADSAELDRIVGLIHAGKTKEAATAITQLQLLNSE